MQQRQPVLALEPSVQLIGDSPMRSQKATPDPELVLVEGIGLRRLAMTM